MRIFLSESFDIDLICTDFNGIGGEILAQIALLFFGY